MCRRRPRLALAPEALRILEQHDWPGNVRELANVLERAAALARERIEPQHLGLEARPGARRGTLRQALLGLERQLIDEALAAHARNITAAARELGIARQQLQRLLRKHRLRPI